MVKNSYLNDFLVNFNLNFYKKKIKNLDPRVKGMIFMDTPIPMLTLFAVYLLIVKYWGPR